MWRTPGTPWSGRDASELDATVVVGQTAEAVCPRRLGEDPHQIFALDDDGARWVGDGPTPPTPPHIRDGVGLTHRGPAEQRPALELEAYSTGPANHGVDLFVDEGPGESQ